MKKAPRLARLYQTKKPSKLVYCATTLVALGPLAPCSVSKFTLWPSASDLNPSALIALWWTNTSELPSVGVINPNPLLSLNHFTVPVAIFGYLFKLLKNNVLACWLLWNYYGRSCCFTLRGTTEKRYKNLLMATPYSNLYWKTIFLKIKTSNISKGSVSID